MTTTTAISSCRDSRVEDTKYLVTEQEWFRGSDLWSTLTAHPTGERPAAAFAVRIGLDGDRVGVLAVIIELTRVSNFLSQLTVGKSASAFILDRDGSAIAAPDVNADEVTPLKLEQPTFPVAVDAIRQAGSAYDAERLGALQHGGRQGRQGLQDRADADLVSGLVAGDRGAGVGISRSGAGDHPQPPDRPCGADRVRRAAVGLAGAAADRGAADQGGERDQACRALRPRQGRHGIPRG